MSYTGPYVVYDNNQAAGILRRQSRYRSIGLPPFHEVLPYNRALYQGRWTNHLTGQTVGVWDYGSAAYNYAWNAEPLSIGSQAYRKAFDSFCSQIDNGTTASMGVTIAESKASFAMISNRSTQLLAAIGSIRRGDFPSLMRNLNLQRNDARGRDVWRRRNPTKDAANHLLEYTFGWVPMVNDVRAACKVLSSTPQQQRLFGSGSEWFLDESGSNLSNPSHPIRYRAEVTRKCYIAGIVTVSNPNLDLANRMGLSNPIQLAWQVIPYSFLVDTFFGVSQYLGRYSAMYGRTLSHGRISAKVEVQAKRIDRQYSGKDLIYSTDQVEWGRHFSRRPVSSLPRPTILPSFKLPVSHLFGRAVTTTALLLQRILK